MAQRLQETFSLQKQISVLSLEMNRLKGIKVSVDLQHIQLTKSGRAMTPFVAGIDKVNHVLNASLMRNAASLYDRVVYVVIGISANGQMNFRATKGSHKCNE